MWDGAAPCESSQCVKVVYPGIQEIKSTVLKATQNIIITILNIVGFLC
jgi:hypothetical protein